VRTLNFLLFSPLGLVSLGLRRRGFRRGGFRRGTAFLGHGVGTREVVTLLGGDGDQGSYLDTLGSVSDLSKQGSADRKQKSEEEAGYNVFFRSTRDDSGRRPCRRGLTMILAMIPSS